VKWFHEHMYRKHQKIAIRHIDTKKYPTIYKYHIEKMRYYATKLGWMF
jgi:hypothetical protein